MKTDVELLRKENESLKASLHFANEDIKVLREALRLMKLKLYGRSSEKMSSEHSDEIQESLFGPDEVPEEPESDDDDVVVPAYRRKKSGRKPLPKDLPREEVIHEVDECERVCACCGEERPELEPKTSEKLKYIPAKVVVEVHIRKTYGECPTCAGLEDGASGVVTAPAPAQLIPKSFATASLLAYTVTSKFVDGLPFYRLEKQLMRQKIPLCRATLSNWHVKLGKLLKPLWELLLEDARASGYMQMDETTFQVLDERGRKNQTKSYMWVALARAPGKWDHGKVGKIVYFRYAPTRAGMVCKSLVDGFKGLIQTDGYTGYSFLKKMSNIVHAGCWSHCRRKFYESSKAARGKGQGQNWGKTFLRYIKELFRIEKKAKVMNLGPSERLELRQRESKEIIDKLKTLLSSLDGKVAPKTLLGKAITYTQKQWPKLIQFLEDGELELSTNWVENSIRPFVVGRKGWLFAGSPEGAESSAIMYSLVETAKACGWEPFSYLNTLFEKLLEVKSDDDYRQLLPYNLQKPSFLF